MIRQLPIYFDDCFMIAELLDVLFSISLSRYAADTRDAAFAIFFAGDDMTTLSPL